MRTRRGSLKARASGRRCARRAPRRAARARPAITTARPTSRATAAICVVAHCSPLEVAAPAIAARARRARGPCRGSPAPLAVPARRSPRASRPRPPAVLRRLRRLRTSRPRGAAPACRRRATPPAAGGSPRAFTAPRARHVRSGTSHGIDQRRGACGIALCAVCSLHVAPTAGAAHGRPGARPAGRGDTRGRAGAAPGARLRRGHGDGDAAAALALRARHAGRRASAARSCACEQQRTLGETLSQQPGVSSTYYGPNASRPIIRGQGGEHIRILNNGLSLLDASGTSVDHAVSLDPITLKRIDVVRGPAALLYGPTAVGGVVNAIDGRIPDVALEGVTTQLEPRWNSASSGVGRRGRHRGRPRGFNFHLDGVGRDTKDLAIPGFARSARLRAVDPLPPGEREAKDRLPNSDSATQAGARRRSRTSGTTATSASRRPGSTRTTAPSPSPTSRSICGRSASTSRAASATLMPHITSIKYKLGLTDYEHTEFEGDGAGHGLQEPRLERPHRRDPRQARPVRGRVRPRDHRLRLLGAGRGGVPAEDDDPHHVGLPLRGDRARPAPLPARRPLRRRRASTREADPQFGPADSRSFATGSGVGGRGVRAGRRAGRSACRSATPRARPNYQELYANGPHLATAAFERGDRNLDVEHSLGIDLRRARRPAGSPASSRSSTTASTATSRSSRRRETVPFEDGTLPGLRLPQRAGGLRGRRGGRDDPARSIAHRTRSTSSWARTTSTRATATPATACRSSRRSASAPALTLRLAARCRPGVEVVHANAQNRLAPGGPPTSPTSIPTDGYTLLNMFLTYNITSGPVRWDLLLRGNNLNNAEAREATSFLKDIAPLPGVGISGGLRATF